MTQAKLLLIVMAPALLLGCPSPGGETPEATFELGMSYIRDGKYDRVWALNTPEYQQQITKELNEQKDTIRGYLAAGGPNVEMIGQFTRNQWRLSPAEVLATPVHELRARVLETRRNQILKLKIVGKVRIEGDRATFHVAESELGTPAVWTLVHRDGRWLVDDTSTGQAFNPYGELRR